MEKLRFAKPQIVPNYLCGAYRSSHGMGLAGFTLLLFPDKTAMIVEFNDIGLPGSPIVAEGRWSISGTGVVLLDWKRWSFKSKGSEEWFIEEYGESTRMVLFLCFDGTRVKNVLLVSEEMISKKIEHAYLRSEEYIDWKKIQKHLKDTD